LGTPRDLIVENLVFIDETIGVPVSDAPQLVLLPPFLVEAHTLNQRNAGLLVLGLKEM
jgi:hypothetical protein